MEIDEFMYSRKSFTESKLSYFHWTYLIIGFNSKRTDWQMVSEFIKYSKHDHHVHNYLGFFFVYFWICIDFNSANQCVAVNFNSITLNTLNYLARAHNQNMICAKKKICIKYLWYAYIWKHRIQCWFFFHCHGKEKT